MKKLAVLALLLLLSFGAVVFAAAPPTSYNVVVRTPNSYGSGVVFPDGKVLTCAHCVTRHEKNTVVKAKNIQLEFDDGTRFSAMIERLDMQADLCLLTSRHRLEGIPIPDLIPTKGETVWVCANGAERRASYKRGIISNTFPGYFLVDCPVVPGDSGGACFNDNGDFIGMCNAMELLLTRYGAVYCYGRVIDLDSIRKFVR